MWNLKIVQDGVIALQREYKNIEDAIREIGLKYYEKNDAWNVVVTLTYVRRKEN